MEKSPTGAARRPAGFVRGAVGGEYGLAVRVGQEAWCVDSDPLHPRAIRPRIAHRRAPRPGVSAGFAAKL